METINFNLYPWFNRIHRGRMSIDTFYAEDSAYRTAIDAVKNDHDIELVFDFGDLNEYSSTEVKQLAETTASLLTPYQFRHQIVLNCNNNKQFAHNFYFRGMQYYFELDQISKPKTQYLVDGEKIIDTFRNMAERDAFIRNGTPKDLLYQLVGVITNELLEKNKNE